MNISLSQPEQKSQVFAYILIALTIFIMLGLTLHIGHVLNSQLSVPFTMIQTSPVIDASSVSTQPVAIPAPMPPAEHMISIATPVALTDAQPTDIPQAIPVPMP